MSVCLRICLCVCAFIIITIIIYSVRSLFLCLLRCSVHAQASAEQMKSKMHGREKLLKVIRQCTASIPCVTDLSCTLNIYLISSQSLARVEHTCYFSFTVMTLPPNNCDRLLSTFRAYWKTWRISSRPYRRTMDTVTWSSSWSSKYVYSPCFCFMLSLHRWLCCHQTNVLSVVALRTLQTSNWQASTFENKSALQHA